MFLHTRGAIKLCEKDMMFQSTNLENILPFKKETSFIDGDNPYINKKTTNLGQLEHDG
jgi:hypothetical protein